jgi:hypothetical protein
MSSVTLELRQLIRLGWPAGGGDKAIKREEDQANFISAVSEEEDGGGDEEEGGDEDGRTEDVDEEYDTENTETDSRISDPDWTPRTYVRR